MGAHVSWFAAPATRQVEKRPAWAERNISKIAVFGKMHVSLTVWSSKYFECKCLNCSSINPFAGIYCIWGCGVNISTFHCTFKFFKTDVTLCDSNPSVSAIIQFVPWNANALVVTNFGQSAKNSIWWHCRFMTIAAWVQTRSSTNGFITRSETFPVLDEIKLFATWDSVNTPDAGSPCPTRHLTASSCTAWGCDSKWSNPPK